MEQRFFTSVREFEDTADPPPSKAETRLIAAVRAGEPYIHADTRPTAPTKDNTVRASLLRLLIMGGTLECGLQSFGVWLEGSWIDGTLDLKFCTAKGLTVLAKCHFGSMPEIAQAHLTVLSLHGSKLSAGLLAGGVHVDGNVFLDETQALGTITINAATIGGQLSCNHAFMSGPLDAGGAITGDALYASKAQIGGSVFLREVEAVGTIDISSATISGQLACERAILSGPQGPEGAVRGNALNAQVAQIGDIVFLDDTEVVGTIDISSAKIGGQLSCVGAKFSGPRDASHAITGKALRAQNANIGDALLLRNTEAMGTITLTGAKIIGPLACEGAVLSGPKDAKGAARGHALHAQSLSIGEGLIFRAVASVEGNIALNAAHCRVLVDDVESWERCEGELMLDGFIYDRIAGTSPLTHFAREEWLQRSTKRRGLFFPQPYRQFAKVLRETGHEAEARRVQIAAEKQRAEVEIQTLPWIFRPFFWLWKQILRFTIGYGYAPARSLWTLAGLIGIAWLLAHLAWDEGSFAPNSGPILLSEGWASVQEAENPAEVWAGDTALGGDWESFHALAYGFDLVVPLIEIGQTQAWAPSTERETWGWVLWWARWVLTVLGWIVTALGAAAVTGIVQRGQPE